MIPNNELGGRESDTDNESGGPGSVSEYAVTQRQRSLEEIERKQFQGKSDLQFISLFN